MSFLTSFGVFGVFSKIFNDCLWTTLCTSIVIATRGLTFQTPSFNVWVRESYLWIFSNGNVRESIMEVSEMYELCGVW